MPTNNPTLQGMNSQEELKDQIIREIVRQKRCASQHDHIDNTIIDGSCTTPAKSADNILQLIEARERAAEERVLDELEAKIKPYGLGETDDEVAWMPVHKALNIITTARQALKEEPVNHNHHKLFGKK